MSKESVLLYDNVPLPSVDLLEVQEDDDGEDKRHHGDRVAEEVDVEAVVLLAEGILQAEVCLRGRDHVVQACRVVGCTRPRAVVQTVAGYVV